MRKKVVHKLCVEDDPPPTLMPRRPPAKEKTQMTYRKYIKLQQQQTYHLYIHDRFLEIRARGNVNNNQTHTTTTTTINTMILRPSTLLSRRRANSKKYNNASGRFKALRVHRRCILVATAAQVWVNILQ